MTIKRLLVYNVVFLVFCAIGFSINFMACYPGFLSPDSMRQYMEASTHTYSTWHPPVMAWVWHYLDAISKGPQLMLALQLSFLWIACYLFAISFRNVVWGLLIIAFFALAPFIHNFSGWIVKDAQMALSWLLAAAIMFKAATSPGKKMGVVTAIISALLIIYGTWLRYNAVTALPPLCVAWAWLAFRNRSRGVKICMTAVLLLITVLGNNVFNNGVVRATKSYTDFQIYFHDIAGVYVRTGKNYFPPAVTNMPGYDTAYIKSHYRPINVTELLWNTDGKVFVNPDSASSAELRSAWLDMIKKDPREYLALRWYIYLRFLNLAEGEPNQYYFVWISDNPYGFKIDPSRLHDRFTGQFLEQENKIYFRVWFWIFLNVLLLPLVFVVRQRHMKLLYFCIAASGFLYTLPQFIVANTTRDFRYIYWACFACIVSLLVLIADRVFLHKRQAE